MLSLGPGFVSARCASCRASAHFDLSGLPVDLRVVLPEPGEPEDELLLAETGHSEYRTFAVVPVAHNDVSDFSDASGFVQRAIDIVNWDGLGEPANRNVVRRDILRIDEVGGRSAVYEAVEHEPYSRVGGLDLQRKVERVGAGGCRDRIALRELTLPSGLTM